MVFSYTVDATPTTGLAANVSMIRPGMEIVTGTWTGGAAATGTIVTGLSDIIIYGVSCNEAKNEVPKSLPNVTGGAVAAAGSIGITGMADATNNTGIWYAIGVM